MAKFGADLSELRHALNEAGSLAKEKGAEIGREFAAGIGVPVGLATMFESAKGVVEFAKQMKDASAELGIGVENLQELGFAFEHTGADAETFNKAMTKLTVNLEAAKNGDSKMADHFGELGITWRELQTLSPDEILMRIAASSDDASDSGARLSAIMEVMGRGGMRMAAGLNGGVEKLKELRAEASKLSADDVEQLHTLGAWFETLTNKVKVAEGRGLAGLSALAVGKSGEDDGKTFAWRTTDLLTGDDQKTAAPDEEELEEKHAEIAKRRAARAEDTHAPDIGGKKSIPVEPRARNEITAEADSAIKGVLGELEAQQKLGDITAESGERALEKRRQIKRIQDEAGYATAEVNAKLIGQSSKRAEIEEQIALSARKIADLQDREKTEPDETRQAEIEKQISGEQDRQREYASQRRQLEEKILEATREVARTGIEGEVKRLETTGLYQDRVKAGQLEIASLEAQIAGNAEKIKTADELRTLELQKQTSELHNQIAAIQTRQRDEWVSRQMAGPAATQAADAQARERARLERQYDRLQALHARHGHAAQDTAGQSYFDSYFKKPGWKFNSREQDFDEAFHPGRSPRRNPRERAFDDAFHPRLQGPPANLANPANLAPPAEAGIGKLIEALAKSEIGTHLSEIAAGIRDVRKAGP